MSESRETPVTGGGLWHAWRMAVGALLGILAGDCLADAVLQVWNR